MRMVLLLIPCLLALVPSTAGAQIAPTLAGGGAAYETYRFQDPEAAGVESLTLLTLPFAAAVPLPASARVEVTGAYARARLVRGNGTESTMDGPTDVQLRLRVPVAGERIVFSGVAVLPTGAATATLEQTEVTGAIASDLLPLRISHWGSGGGAGLGVTLAHSVGRTGVGFGASYMVSRSFDPLQDAGFAAYHPGDQIGLQLALNQTVGNAAKASLQIALQRQSNDQLEGTNLFRSGNRYQAVGSYAFRAGRTASGIVYAGGQHREQGTALLDLTRDTPAQELIMAGGGLRMPLSGRVVVVPTVDGRLLRSADGLGQGHLGGAGAAVEVSTAAMKITPRVRAQYGSVLIRAGVESGLVGVDVGVTVNFGSIRP
jgi:hypothetical protein